MFVLIWLIKKGLDGTPTWGAPENASIHVWLVFSWNLCVQLKMVPNRLHTETHRFPIEGCWGVLRMVLLFVPCLLFLDIIGKNSFETVAIPCKGDFQALPSHGLK